MKSTLKLKNAAFGYKDKPVLGNINLEVESGEVLAVVGPNGVGKSTLIKAASGILPLQYGKATIGGKDLSLMSPADRARQVAVVPQAAQLPESFRALDVVVIGRTPFLGWLEREKPSDRDLAYQAMLRTGVEDLAERLVGELSGGEQQRVLIARGLAQSSQVLLLDEPTAHLDLKHQDEILKLIRTLAVQEQMAILITLHDLNLVARYADRVALLSNGAVRKEGRPQEVLTPDELTPVYGIELHVTDHPIHGTPLVLSRE